MNAISIRTMLKSEHSKSNTYKIVNMILGQPKTISELMECFFDDDIRICQRASWPVGIIGEKHPEILIKSLPKLIENLKAPKHDAIVRNTVRTWQFMPIPEEFQGEIYEICFQYIQDVKIPTAIKAFSMTVCANIAQKLPELKEELKMVLEDQLEFATSGVQSRANKIISQL